MPDARFEIRDAAGAVVWETSVGSGLRLLRVLTASDVQPNSNTFSDPEILTTGTLIDGKGLGSVSNGSVTYTQGGAKNSVLMY